MVQLYLGELEWMKGENLEALCQGSKAEEQAQGSRIEVWER